MSPPRRTQSGARTDGAKDAGGKVPAPATPPKDADSPTSKPHGTVADQVATMESEGQAQPQADERAEAEDDRDEDRRR
ncbi:MAG: hypothetical protein AB7U83_15030 [Vicinamibacterales bacterium]